MTGYLSQVDPRVTFRTGHGREGGLGGDSLAQWTSDRVERRGRKPDPHGDSGCEVARCRRTRSIPACESAHRCCVCWRLSLCLASATLPADETASSRSSSAPSECAKCHQGLGFGYQQCLMLLTPIPRPTPHWPYPKSKEIARLSGIPEEPQKAAMCLGCHATGAGGRRVGEGRDVSPGRWRAVREVPRPGQRVHGRGR